MQRFTSSVGAVSSGSSQPTRSKHRVALRIFWAVSGALIAASLVPAIPVAAKPASPSSPSISSAPSTYTAVTPVRLMDTRNAGGPLGPQVSRDLTVAGVTPGAPAAATAVVLNVTVVNTTAASFLTVYPAGNSRPLASNLNWKTENVIPNLVESPVGTGGAVTIYNQWGSTDVVVDLEGYFTAPSGTSGGQVALTPYRITDTRAGSGQANAGSKVGAQGSLDIQVTGTGGASGIPASGVSGAILNVTTVNSTAASFLTVWPTGAARPLASNLNWVAGQVIPNRVFVPVGTGGKVSVYNQWGSTDVVVDVSGYFTDATAAGKPFVTQSPVRLADTRNTGGTLGSGGVYTLQVGGVSGVPANASAVILNVTVTNTNAASFLTVYPSTSTRPLASDLNWTAGVTIPNLTVATLGTTGAVSFYNSAGSTDLVVDLFGYFGVTGPVVSVAAVPSTIAPNGTSTSTVTATVTNAGAPVVGNTVTFTVGTGTPAGACGTLSAATGVTDSTGKATTTYKSSTTAGTCMVTATESGGASGTTTITQSSVANQAYTVTPAGSATVPISTTTSPDAGNVTYNATGLPASSTVCISLFPKDGPNAPVNSAGTWTFNPSGATPITALGEGGTDAAPNPPGTASGGFIRSINGAPTGLNDSTNTTRHVCTIGTGTTGSVAFILNSFVPDRADVVVYRDVNLDGKFNVDSTGNPTEPFGASDPTWQAPAAGIGSYSGLIVQSIDTTAKAFQACTTPGTGSTCNTFSYGTAGNTFNYPSPGSSGTGTVPLTQAQFESYLSAQAPPFCAPPCPGTTDFTPAGSQVRGDQLNIVNYNPSASSQFTISQGAGTNGDVPAAPTGVTAANTTANPAGVKVTWTAPSNPDVAQDASNSAMYCVLRATVTSGSVGTFGPFTGSGNANCPTGGTGNAIVASGGAPPATTLTDVSATGGTIYVYEVFAQADTNGGAKWGPASAQSSQVTATAAPKPTPVSTTSVFTEGTTTTTEGLKIGDTLQFIFTNVSSTNPLTVASGASVTLADEYGAQVSLTNGVNATFIVSGTGTVLTMSVTGAPTLLTPASPGNFSPNPLLLDTDSKDAVVSATGISNTAGPWNLPASGCDFGSNGCPATAAQRSFQDGTFPSPNDSSLPNAITVGNVSAKSPNTVKITTAGADSGDGNGTSIATGDTVGVFDGSGKQIGTGTWDSTLATNTITTTTSFAPGDTLFVVWVDSASASFAQNKPSVTTQVSTSVYTFTPKPIAAIGTLGPSTPVAITLNTGTAASIVYLSFTSGATPTASASVGGVALTGTPAAFTADSSGNVFITYTSSSGGNSPANSSVLDTITAQNGPTSASTTQIGSDSYQYAAALPTATNSTLFAAPANVPDNGSTSSTVTVTLKNGVGAAVAGKMVVLCQNAGAHSTITLGTAVQGICPAAGAGGNYGSALTTNGSGQASWTVTDASPETVTYTATDTTDSVVVTQTAAVNFFQRVNNTNSTLTATPPGPLTAGTSTSITATVLDDSSKPIVGYSVTLGTSIGCNAVITGTNPQGTNSSGQSTWSVNDPTAQSCTFTAAGAALNGGPALNKSVVVTWNPGAVTAGNSSATAFPVSGVPDNNDSGGAPAHSNITVTLRDVNGNAVSGKNVSLSATTNGAGGTINGVTTAGPEGFLCTSNFFCVTDGNGQVVFRVGDNAVETVTYTATDTTDSIVVTQTPTVGFVNPVYTSATGTGASLQTTATFTDAVCRIAGAPGVFAAGDWTVTGSVQGAITVVSDSATTCPAAGTTTVTLTLASPMATGQTITVALNASGAAKFNNVTGHAPVSASHTFGT